MQPNYDYAVTDEHGNCISVVSRPDPVDSPSWLLQQEYDSSVLGKHWDGEQWQEAPAT